MNLLHFEILIFMHFSLLATGIALDGNPYWISLEIGALSWKPNCLWFFSGELDPRLSITSERPKSNKVASEWILESKSSEIKAGFARQFTYWEGSPEDIRAQILIVGTDPVFHFQRVCDESPSVFILHKELGINRLSGENDFGCKNSTNENKSSGEIIQIQARCFNATLIAKKYACRCPWCTSPNRETVQAQLEADELAYSGAMFATFWSTHANARFLICALILITVLNLLSFSCLLLIGIKKRFERKVSTSPTGGILGYCSQLDLPNPPPKKPSTLQTDINMLPKFYSDSCNEQSYESIVDFNNRAVSNTLNLAKVFRNKTNRSFSSEST